MLPLTSSLRFPYSLMSKIFPVPIVQYLTGYFEAETWIMIAESAITTRDRFSWSTPKATLALSLSAYRRPSYSDVLLGRSPSRLWDKQVLQRHIGRHGLCSRPLLTSLTSSLGQYGAYHGGFSSPTLWPCLWRQDN